MFMGEFHHSLDAKGRLIIPNKLRFDLHEEYVITKGLDKCLFLYSLDEWNNIINELNTLKFTNKNVRAFERVFIGSASLDRIDKQGRINIPYELLSYASINKECIIIGVKSRIEIWNKDNYYKYINDNDNVLEILAGSLFEGDNYEA